MRSSTGLVLALFGLAACGGKVLEDPNATVAAPAADPAPAPTPPALATSAAPASSTPTVADACGAICDRNGRCGAQTSDCVEHCTGEIEGSSGCYDQANAYIHCYADHLTFDSECAALPPACEQAYCVYSQCTGRVLPGYCH